MERDNGIVSTVTMVLKDYEDMKDKIQDLESRVNQLTSTLQDYSRFMRELDDNPTTIKIYSDKLEQVNKIGSAFYQGFEEFKDLIANDLIK